MGKPKQEYCLRGHKRVPENLLENGTCRKCNSYLALRWKRANPERRKELDAKERDNGGRERTHKWVEENKERKRELDKNYRENPENKERITSSKRKRAAIKKGCISEPYTEAEVLSKVPNNCCYLCGLLIDIDANRKDDPLSLSIEHIIALINGGPDIIDNVMPSHRTCNSSKGSRSPEELPEGWVEKRKQIITGLWELKNGGSNEN